MDYNTYWNTVFIMAGVCLGWRTITDKKMLLYFIRKPFEDLTGWKKKTMGPLILCIVCMSSVYGTIVFWFLHGSFNNLPVLHISLPYPIIESIYWKWWVGACVTTAFIGGFLRLIYEVFENMLPISKEDQFIPCPKCKGEKLIEKKDCPKCFGLGLQPKWKRTT